MASKATVALLRVSADSILSDIDRLVDLAGVSSALAAGKTTILKDNISWHCSFPAANTTPWQLEGTIQALARCGFTDQVCVQNKTVVTNAFTGTGAAKLVFSVLAAGAEMERERIGERVRSVKQHLREGGYFTGGHLARGYHKTADGKLVEDAGWKKCLAAMKRMRQEAVPYRDIAGRIGKDFGISLDYSTVHRIPNGKRELDAVRVA